MAQLVINVGTAPNDGTGDPIRTAYQKVNTNFSELFSRVQTSPPATLKGSLGDQAGMIAYTPTYFYYCFADYTNGINNIWATIDQTGNVIAETLQDGTSSVTFETASGPVVVTVNGVGNIAVFDQTGAVFSNVSTQALTSADISATGNILAGAKMSATTLEVQGAITALTSVTAGYFYGNGAFLTGISGGGGASGSQIYNGFTKVDIPSVSGNVVFDVGLNPGLAIFSPSGVEIDGTLSASGISGTLSTPSQPGITSVGTLTSLSVAGDISSGNLSATNLTGTLATAAQPNITSVGTLASLDVVGAVSSASLSATDITGTLTTAAQPNIKSVGTLDSLTVTGNISGSNIDIAGDMVTTGNISATNITATGNSTAVYFIGDGSLLTNISGVGVYGNTQVAQYLPTYTGNLNPGNVNTTSLRANSIRTNGSSSLTVIGNTIFQNNVTVQGNLNANLNGNVTGTLTGTSTGTHNGLVYSIDIRMMSWDFGFISANTYTNPIQYLLAQTGNVDMGTFLAPASLEIDTGTF